MTLPVSGPISLSAVNTELGLASTTLISLNQASVRTLAGVSSGAISLNNLYGKSNVFAFTISTNQTNANLRTLALAAGWGGTSAVQATINAGVSINGTVQNNSTAALTIDGSFPAGVTLTNNGTIVGVGGNGGISGGGEVGQAGGRAMLASVAVTIANNGTIAGGGGGGSAAGNSDRSATCNMGEDSSSSSAAGGGGGGGQSSYAANAPGGSGGVSSGSSDCSVFTNGGTGGTGTSSAAGAGGSRGRVLICNCTLATGYGTNGNAGGAWGTNGTGGLGAGQAISGNSNITWTAFGTRTGPIV
jgi:hypothetical protein